MIPSSLLLLVALASAPPTVETVVQRLQAVYDETEDLQARFTQVYRFKVNGLERKSEGRVYLKKPGRMRWDYEQPRPRYFVSDGEVLWIYVPDDGQAFKQPLAQSQVATVLSFLLGTGDLEQAFTHRLLPAAPSGNHRLELVPKEGLRTFRRVVLTVDAKTWRVIGTEIEDPVGNLNRVSFSGLKVNQGLPNDGFSFTPPEGTRVIHGGRP